MAAITRVAPLHVSPTAYEVIDRGKATESIAKSDQIVISGASGSEQTVSKCPAGAIECHGIALKAALAGQLCEYGVQGEMDGFSGMTPGAALYPSASTAGVIDTTATATPIARVRAVLPTRIRYSYV
jgi:hypothetical protein